MHRADYIKKIVEYFVKNLKKGYTEDALKWALIKQGYSRASVLSAAEEAHKELSKTAPLLKTKPEIKYELLNEDNITISLKKPWWKRIFGM